MQAKKSRTPERTCIGCRTRQPVDALARIVWAADELLIGAPGHGRGAWLCRAEDGLFEPACCEAAGSSGAFSRAFRTKLRDRSCADTLLGWPGKPTH